VLARSAREKVHARFGESWQPEWHWWHLESQSADAGHSAVSTGSPAARIAVTVAWIAAPPLSSSPGPAGRWWMKRPATRWQNSA